MVGKVRWIHGELLRKKWGISPILLETFVAGGLPVFDEDGTPFVYEEGIPGTIDTYKFRLDDVERFERENENLSPTEISQGAPEQNDELGRRMTAEQVAVALKMNVKKVRSLYKELGGMRLGRNYLLFERSVQDAIQKRTEVDSPGAERREATGEGVSDKEAGIGMGGQDAAKTLKRLEREDRHGLYR